MASFPFLSLPLSQAATVSGVPGVSGWCFGWKSNLEHLILMVNDGNIWIEVTGRNGWPTLNQSDVFYWTSVLVMYWPWKTTCLSKGCVLNVLGTRPSLINDRLWGCITWWEAIYLRTINWSPTGDELSDWWWWWWWGVTVLQTNMWFRWIGPCLVYLCIWYTRSALAQ